MSIAQHIARWKSPHTPEPPHPYSLPQRSLIRSWPSKRRPSDPGEKASSSKPRTRCKTVSDRGLHSRHATSYAYLFFVCFFLRTRGPREGQRDVVSLSGEERAPPAEGSGGLGLRPGRRVLAPSSSVSGAGQWKGSNRQSGGRREERQGGGKGERIEGSRKKKYKK